MNQKKSAWKRYRTAFFLCVTLIVSSLIATYYVEQVFENLCLRVMQETVEQGATDIRIMFEGEERNLDTVSSLLATYDTLTEEICETQMDSLNTENLISAYAVCLPNGEVVTSTDTLAIDFSELDLQTSGDGGVSLSEVFEDASGAQYVAYVSDINDGGESKGTLYGCVRLAELPEILQLQAFNGNCQMYLIDTESGDFLMDTWHERLGNINDEDMKGRKIKVGGSREEQVEKILAGESGYMVFVSNTTGEDFYTCYTSVDAYNLSFQITVPRSVAFAEAVLIQRIVFVLCAIQIVVCLCYMLGVLRKTRMEIKKEQEHLQLSRSVNEVQQMLFTIYREPKLMNTAMEKAAEAFGADRMVFTTMNQSVIEQFYSWPVRDEAEAEQMIGRNLEKETPEIFKRLTRENAIVLEQEEAGAALGLPEKSGKISCIVAARVTGADGQIIGIMNAVNVSNPQNAKEGLKRLAGSFHLAQQLMDSYEKIHETGITDALTRLKNRHAYQQEVDACETCNVPFLCSIYVDANGLHDLNNRLGHAAGDDLLITIANQMQDLFGNDCVYRIGGDEFLAICKEFSPDEIVERIRELRARLKRKEYYVSAGFAFRSPENTMEQTILVAEKRMYADKEEFYKGNKNRRSRVVLKE